MMRERIVDSLDDLQKYCEMEGFKGWDPFDGLNSRFFHSIPFLKNSSLARLAWIQFFKRFPINLRDFMMVGKDYNPKGLGLFLSGYCNLWKLEQKQEYLDMIRFLSGLLIRKQSTGWSGACWGYNFDWQARAFFQPRDTPTVVASSFIANALLDASDILNDDDLKNTAFSVADFIIHDLNRTNDASGNFAFSYSPMDRTTVFNASLLGSRILSRIYSYTGNLKLKEDAEKSVRFCINHQHADGSWFYSPLSHHRWIDNFHTGFNLECILQFDQYTGNHLFTENFEKGFRFYIENFFTNEGIPKYYHNSVYPVDLHSTAQLIITCSRTGRFMENKDLIDRVTDWTLLNMRSKKGYFYYQKTKFYTNRIPYMRWTQAWMFLALTEYLLQTNSASNK